MSSISGSAYGNSLTNEIIWTIIMIMVWTRSFLSSYAEQILQPIIFMLTDISESAFSDWAIIFIIRLVADWPVQKNWKEILICGYSTRKDMSCHLLPFSHLSEIKSVRDFLFPPLKELPFSISSNYKDTKGKYKKEYKISYNRALSEFSRAYDISSKTNFI